MGKKCDHHVIWWGDCSLGWCQKAVSKICCVNMALEIEGVVRSMMETTLLEQVWNWHRGMQSWNTEVVAHFEAVLCKTEIDDAYGTNSSVKVPAWCSPGHNISKPTLVAVPWGVRRSGQVAMWSSYHEHSKELSLQVFLQPQHLGLGRSTGKACKSLEFKAGKIYDTFWKFVFECWVYLNSC